MAGRVYKNENHSDIIQEIHLVDNSSAHIVVRDPAIKRNVYEKFLGIVGGDPWQEEANNNLFIGFPERDIEAMGGLEGFFDFMCDEEYITDQSFRAKIYLSEELELRDDTEITKEIIVPAVGQYVYTIGWEAFKDAGDESLIKTTFHKLNPNTKDTEDSQTRKFLTTLGEVKKILGSLEDKDINVQVAAAAFISAIKNKIREDHGLGPNELGRF